MHSAVLELINEKIYQTEEKLSSIGSPLNKLFPIDTIIKNIASLPAYSGYSFLGESTIYELDAMGKRFGAKTEALFCQLIILRFAEISIKRLGQGVFPATIEALYTQWLQKIILDFPLKIKGYYYENDLFLKYLSVCSMRCLPVGGAWIAEQSGISRRFLFTGGFVQFFKSLFFLLFSMRGSVPFYQIHMVQSMKDQVNPEGRYECYRGVSELLKVNKDVKGMLAGSWYYDPAIQSISPRLSYLSQNAIENGAKVFKVGSTAADINNATLRSNTRKKLYEAKKYLPTTYLLIWPRKNLIKWSSENY